MTSAVIKQGARERRDEGSERRGLAESTNIQQASMLNYACGVETAERGNISFLSPKRTRDHPRRLTGSRLWREERKYFFIQWVID